MNKFIEIQLKRTSVKSFKNKPLTKEQEETLKKVINSVPTSINGQSFSAIFITNKKLKAQMSEWNWNQKHIAQAPLFILFLMDCSRVTLSSKIYNHKKEVNEHLGSVENMLVAVGDAFIGAQSALDAAISMGLGTCYIGGVRLYSDKLVKIFNLPKYVMPLVGLLVGNIDHENGIKPKINKVYKNTYDLKKVELELSKYNKVMKDYYLNYREMSKHPENDYSKNTIKTLTAMNGKNMYKTYEPTLKKQKYLTKKK